MNVKEAFKETLVLAAARGIDETILERAQNADIRRVHSVSHEEGRIAGLREALEVADTKYNSADIRNALKARIAELSSRKTFSYGKACRWLGWAQAATVAYGHLCSPQ